MSARNKVLTLAQRYDFYIAAQERELQRLTQSMSQSFMGEGRKEAVFVVLGDLRLYKALYTENDPGRIHALLVTVQSYMDALTSQYKTMNPDERNQAQGAYAEYKRQLEQIRNLLTPMKAGK